LLTNDKKLSQKLFMIGNAHLDPVWLWQWQDGFHEAKATFRSALDRMREFPDFVFVSSSAAYFEWIEQNEPTMFAEIRQRIAEGRWQLVGGWWVEPDCNLPAGESFARQGLYGQRYFKEKFGVTARCGYNVDSFGHNAMLPQILKKSGMDRYVFLRPSPHEKGLPGRLFWWESDDGSRVMAFRIPYEYCSWGKDIQQHITRCAAELRDPFSESMCFYGVGNHGGGPTIENLESIHRLMEDPQLPSLVLASPDEFFDAASLRAERLPVVHDELQHHASGCYAVHSGVKQWNRRAENRLLAAEKLSAVSAWAVSLPYPQDFGTAWKSVLFNQFHDILAGTSIESAYEDARDQYGEALSIAGRNLNNAVQALGWHINIQPEERLRPVIVFNPNAWAGTQNIEVEMSEIKPDDVLLDENDQPVPFQTVRSQATALGRNRLTFTADLPALGYRTFRVVPRKTSKTFADVQASDTVLENNRFRLEFDPETGYIRSLRDKQADLEIFTASGAVPVVYEDHSDTWGHNAFTFDRAVGMFKASSVRLIEHGPVKAVIRVISEWGRSRIVQEFAMYAGMDAIDVNVMVDWHEQRQVLKLRFPLHLYSMNSTYEIPYGSIVRPACGEEEPAQNWVDVSGLSKDNQEMYGFSLINDGKYSFDVRIRDIGMTVLRSPVYANHMPVDPQEGEEYSYIDQGIQRFRYRMLPHRGIWADSGTVRQATEFNQPPVVLLGTSHAGELPQTDSYISVEPENVLASVIKLAEDGGAWIVRAYETAGMSAHACLQLSHLGREIRVDFDPYEIKTFRIPFNADEPVGETNLLEWVDEEETK